MDAFIITMALSARAIQHGAHRHDLRGIYRCVLLLFRGRIEIDHSYGLRCRGLCCHSRHSTRGPAGAAASGRATAGPLVLCREWQHHRPCTCQESEAAVEWCSTNSHIVWYTEGRKPHADEKQTITSKTTLMTVPECSQSTISLYTIPNNGLHLDVKICHFNHMKYLIFVTFGWPEYQPPMFTVGTCG